MYQVCPKCGHDNGTGNSDRCANCGVVFEKWLRARLRVNSPRRSDARRERRSEGARGWLSALLYVDGPVNPVIFWARVLLWIMFLVWGTRFLLMDYRALDGGLPPINGSIMHSVNLVFHEAGHVIFRLFGDFMTVLGGSLAQLLIPAVVVVHLLAHQRDNFGASVGLWWLGQSMLDLAPYIHDARAGRLLLLGGTTGQDSPDFHDWHNLLGRTGMLEYDHALAGFTYFTGVLMILAAFAWGGAVLWRQYKTLDR